MSPTWWPRARLRAMSGRSLKRWACAAHSCEGERGQEREEETGEKERGKREGRAKGGERGSACDGCTAAWSGGTEGMPRVRAMLVW